MKLNNGLKNLQVDVPHEEYGKCDYFMPKEMGEWIRALGLRYSLSSQSLWGNGFDNNGRSTAESHYCVYGCKPEDASAFAILFPKCKIHIFDQYSDD